MKKYILAVLFLCVMALAGCVQAESIKKTDAEHEAAMKTVEGREAFIAEELYEGAKILSEIKNEETGFIVSEFVAGDLHSFVFFRPTDKGYSYNGEAEHALDDMITEAYAPMGDGDYHVFLRHSDDIVAVDVTYMDAETNEVLQQGTVTFADGNLVLLPKDENINHWYERIVAYDQNGQEYILRSGEPLDIDLVEELEKERDRRFVRKVIRFAVIFGTAFVIDRIRRKK